MSKPTTIRLDQPTLDRIAAVQDAATVPVSRSAVAQEAIRRGLAEIERERAPHGGMSRILNTFEGNGKRAEVVTSNGHYRVDVYQRESESTWSLLSFVSSGSLGWCEQYAQCVVLGTVVLSGILDRKPKEATPCEP